MSSPPPEAKRRRSISYTPDEEDDDEQAQPQLTESRRPSVAAQDHDEVDEGVDGADAEAGSDEGEDDLDETRTNIADTTMGDVTRADGEDDEDDEDEDEEENDDDDDDEVSAVPESGTLHPSNPEDDVKPPTWALSSGKKSLIDPLAIIETPIPDDTNPGSANLYSTATGEKLLRNTPIKKQDGTIFLRSDIQHAMLMEIFNDTTRCFRNPRPAPDDSWTVPPKPGEAAATGVPEYTPVYPYGQSKGSARRSNETEEEFKAWKKRWEEYHKNPYPTKEEDPENKVPRPGAKLMTFKELYMEALMNSPRCTKAVRDKIWADEQFAEDFACVNLLINVGRMNTTLACECVRALARDSVSVPLTMTYVHISPKTVFAQMQTVLRSYHPLPCLQRCENSRKHMQDAPRMKSLLKSVLLPFEKASTGPGSAPISKTAQAAQAQFAVPANQMLEIPATLDEVLKRYTDGHVPSTSVVNIIFILAAQANDLTAMHFTHPHDAHSIFFPHKDYPIPARDRAKCFLWLVWHYLEGAALLPPGNDKARSNPFGDERTVTSAARAKAKWDSLDEKSRKKATVGGKGTLWLGVRNKREKLKKSEDEAVEPSSVAPAGPEDDTGEQPPVEATPSGSSMAAAPAKSPTPPAESNDSTWEVEEGERYTHRQLAPHMNVTSQLDIRKENVDMEDELEWGNEQAAERREFMARMAEEERLKGTAVEVSSGKGKGKGKGKGTATKGKGKKGKGYSTSATGTEDKRRKGSGASGLTVKGKGEGSSTGVGRGGRRKNVDILGADDSSVASAAAAVLAGQPGVRGKRRRLSAHSAAKAREALQELGVKIDDASTAEEIRDAVASGLDISNPDHEALLTTVLQQAGTSIGGSAKKRGSGGGGGSSAGLPAKRPLTRDDLQPGLDFEAESGGVESLPALAWNRILQRALRGQGDACYDSDGEDEAMDEADRCGEMFRGELSRVLNALWNTSDQIHAEEKSHGGQIRDPFLRRREELVAAVAK